ncbi:MAG: TldD/PmbA family protein [Candidatus Bathyarchaeia archaeon]
MEVLSLSMDLLEFAVEVGLSLGARFCEARYFEERINSISVENGIAKALSSGILRGISVRVIASGHWGFASTNVLTKESAERTVRDAISGAKSISAYAIEEAQIANAKPSADKVLHGVKIKPENIDPEIKVKKVLDLEKAAREFDNRVKDTLVAYRDIITRVIVHNSLGTLVEEITPRTIISCRVIAREGSFMQSGYEVLGNVAGYELIEETSPENFSIKAAEKAVSLLSAKAPPRGKFSVVVDPKVGGLFVHEAIGHNSEGDLVYGGQSIMANKLGQKVASELVTIIDDPSAKGYGRFTYDHEGVRAKPHLIIKDGVLVGFLHSLETAAKLGGEPEGSARAQSHHYPPIVRMSNIYLAPRDMILEEIMEDINYGLYLSGSEYGYVESEKGQFTCKVEEAWLIKRGELREHLRDVAISSLIFEALKNITAVGRDMRLEMPGMCGKSGQSIYVDGGAPHFRIDGIIVGGRS